jgi:large subunit ribosomal protein L15
LGFEGGQTKFYKLLPKHGFTNKTHKAEMLSVNLGTLQDFIDMGRLPQVEEGKVLTMQDLVSAGVATSSSVKHGMKLLAKGKERLASPIQIEISRASGEAIRAIEEAGGEVTTVHYNRLALRALLKPEKFERLPKFARPPPKWQPYYTNWHGNRGYLSVQAQMRDLLKERPELQETFADALEASRQKEEQDDAK